MRLFLKDESESLLSAPAQPTEKCGLLQPRRHDLESNYGTIPDSKLGDIAISTNRCTRSAVITVLQLCTIFLLAGCLFIAQSPFQDDQVPGGPKHHFVFGDSYTSTQFDINGRQPSLPDNPMGNTDVGDHQTSANGPVWINFLTTKYNPMPVLTYNFALGGASIPDHFTYQVNNLWQPKYSTADFWTSSNTLFMSWIGINDCTFCWLRGAKLTIIDERLEQYWALMETLYLTGTRNLFIVNVPPLSRSPVVKGAGPTGAENYRKCVQHFNDKLPAHMQAWARRHPDATVKLYDVHTIFGNVLDDPPAFGFIDDMCSDENGCLWTGNFHISSPMHELIAKDMRGVLSNFTFTR